MITDMKRNISSGCFRSNFISMTITKRYLAENQGYKICIHPETKFFMNKYPESWELTSSLKSAGVEISPKISYHRFCNYFVVRLASLNAT